MRANKRTILHRITAILAAVCLLFGGEVFSGTEGLFGVLAKGGLTANAADADGETAQTGWDWSWNQPHVIENASDGYKYEYPLYNFAKRGADNVFYRMNVTTIRMKEADEDGNPFTTLEECVAKFGTGNNIYVSPDYYVTENYIPDDEVTIVDKNAPSYNGTYTIYTRFTLDPSNPGRYYRLDPVLNNDKVTHRVQFFGNKLGGSGGWVRPHNWEAETGDPAIKTSFHRDFVIWLVDTGKQTVYNFVKVKDVFYRLNKQDDGIFGGLANLVEKEKTLDPELWPSLVEPYDFSGFRSGSTSVTANGKTYYYFDSAMLEAGMDVPEYYFTIDGEEYELGVHNRFTSKDSNYDEVQNPAAEKYWLGTDRAADWGANHSTDYRYHRDFTAVLHERANKYTATFKNGTDVLSSDEFDCGTAPAYGGETPTKDEDTSYVYIFAGWKAEDGTVYAPDAELPASLGDVTYQAVFSTLTKIKITAKDTGKEYGATDPELEWEVDKALSEDDLANLSVQVSRESGEEIKEYVITASGEENQGQYHITFAAGTFTIRQSSGLTVSLEGSEFTYDGTAKHIENSPTNNAAGGETTYTYSFEENGTYVDDLASLKKTDAGIYTVHVKATNPNYSNTARTTATLKIAPKEVTITANDQNKKYGDTDPDFDATVTGLADGDDESVLTYEVSCEHDEDAGVYTITVTAETDQGNYTVKTVNGAFTIGTYNGVIVKIVGNTKTSVYDGTEQTVEGYTVTMESGLYTLNDFKFTGYASATAKNVGKTEMGLSADQFVNKNSNFSEVAFIVTDGWLMIDPAEAKVTAQDATKAYGDKDPELTAEVTGVFGDDKLTYELTRETGENIGTYAIGVGGDEVQGNYVVSYEGAEFAIERREITVKADDIVKTYGKGDPELTVTIENMPGEYSVSLEDMLKATFTGAPYVNLSIRLPGTLHPFGLGNRSVNYKASAGTDVIRFTVSREEGEDVGTYKITVTGEEIQGNYKVAFAEGTFEVVTASGLELTNLTPKSAVYDGKEHPVEVEVSVTAGTKVEYSTDGGNTWSTDAPSFTNVGTVKVKVRATNKNLEDADLDVEFTVEPKAVTVRVKDASKKVGEADPTWETETEGLIDGDKVAFTVSRAAGETVGEYAIKASGEAAQGNYTVTFADGKLTITNANGDVPSPKTADTMPIVLLAAVLFAAFAAAATAKKRRESAE
ncbi:MAG: hypothetical protein K6B39_01160 [Lachnospiraceae bacterium]|nr:hypothetical protein [Lachnospiraceae bacterium]